MRRLALARQPYDVTIQLPSEKHGSVRLARLNPEAAVNNLEQIRNVKVSDLASHPLRVTMYPYQVYWVELTESR